MKVLFLGMTGGFSQEVLAQLLAAGTPVAAVLLAGEDFRALPAEASPPDPLALPVLNAHVAPSPVALAQQAEIPAFECGRLNGPSARAWLAELAPDVACVACWNRVIPADVLALPRHGFLNVHPSLLPAYRGPEPLFWQFRAGASATGVTVHWMDSGLDTGDIAGQQPLAFPDGIRGPAAEELCARAGGALLADVLARLSAGDAVPRQPQPAGGSYFPAPGPADFCLDPAWTARRAFNFMRGTAAWGQPYRLEVDGRVLWLREALAWQAGASPAARQSDFQAEGAVPLAFADGVLWAKVQGEAVHRADS